LSNNFSSNNISYNNISSNNVLSNEVLSHDILSNDTSLLSAAWRYGGANHPLIQTNFVWIVQNMYN
jgi:hypothetical protein